ncbi:MAG TPA: DNA mismatch repair endonuclease MutL [Terriglobia bacterium]|nr:DNA mismatch repair endonuclease MutL [Terriglobia bacterium]
MSVIRILPEAVANKIAAGEVVERPASVVKELLENSLDAGASRVDVCVEAGGKRLIRVEDDGCGMDRDDAVSAFERHATSKIKSSDDLFEIATLGFRGEALPSIASVSRVLLETRHASESAGIQVEIAGGRLRDIKEVARPPGTRLEVRDLFYNTPARRKFLKSESTELGHVASLVTHYALAHPEKSFRLVSFTHEILNASPVAAIRERLYQVMGAQTLEQLIEIAPVERNMPVAVAAETEPEEIEPAKIRLLGFVSRPEIQKLNRNQIYFFVNRRLVRDRLILHSITEAYRNIFPSGVFPVALVFLELPPSEVDVNVHPSKTEVRFRHSSFIHDFARDAIRGALIASRPMAAFPSRKASGSKSPLSSSLEADAAERLAEDGSPAASLAPPAPEIRPIPAPRFSQPQGAYAPGFALSPPQPVPETGSLPLTGGVAPPLADAAELAPAANELSFPRANCNGVSARDEFARCGLTEAQAGLAGQGIDSAEAVTSGSGEFPRNLRPLGQVHQSFIVATNDESLWIIDQHVAHERVLFERHLRVRLDAHAESQRLLLPIVVELQPAQQAVLQEISQELARSGFEAEPFGQRTFAIKAAPAEIRPEDTEKLLLEILDDVNSEARSLTLEDLRHKIAASVACHAAIKINMLLDYKKMEWLLRELEKTECPMTCPHGRPILLRYSLREIQKAFKRI